MDVPSKEFEFMKCVCLHVHDIPSVWDLSGLQFNKTRRSKLLKCGGCAGEIISDLCNKLGNCCYSINNSAVASEV